MYCLHTTAVWKIKLRSVWPPFLEIHGGNHERCGSGRKSRRSTNTTAQRLSVGQTLTGNRHILGEVRVCAQAVAGGSASVCKTPRASARLLWDFIFFLMPITAARFHYWIWKYLVWKIVLCHICELSSVFLHSLHSQADKSDVKYLCSSLMREKSWCLFSTSGVYFINANFIDSRKCFFTCVYSGRLKFAWNCVTHWLLSTICAHQYSCCIHSKPLTTPFSCSCLLSFQTLGAQWPRSLQLVFSTLERKVKKFHISRVQDPIWQNLHSTTNIFLLLSSELQMSMILSSVMHWQTNIQLPTKHEIL